MHISGMGCGRCIGACAFDDIENINGNAPELLGRKMADEHFHDHGDVWHNSNPNVSWAETLEQAEKIGVDNTRLVVTAQAEADNRLIIEGVERPDKNFCIGIQFHPEVEVRKYVDKEKDAETFMDYDTALSFFRALIDASHGAS